MAFNDLQLKVASESAVIAAHANMAKLNVFAKSYSELNGVPGQSIAIPVYDLSAAATFSAGTNDYGTGGTEVDGMILTIDQHLVKSVSITDRQLAETGISWAKDTTAALADTLTRGVNKYVFGLLGGADITLESSFDATAKNVVANLYKVAADNDIPVDRCVVVLSPTQYAKVLSLLDANVYGGWDAIKYGYIPGLYGFKAFVCSTFLPEGVNGAIMMDSSIGIASRYLAPATPGAYPESWMAATEDGFAMGFRRFMDLNSGTDKFACDVLFGAKVLQANKIVKLV